MLCPLALASKQRCLGSFLRGGLAIVLLQFRLVVEEVHVWRPAVHEEEDTGLRLSWQTR